MNEKPLKNGNILSIYIVFISQMLFLLRNKNFAACISTKSKILY